MRYSVLWRNPGAFVPDPAETNEENVARAARAALAVIVALSGFTGDLRWIWLVVPVLIGAAWALPEDPREGFGDAPAKAACSRRPSPGDPTGNVVYGKDECPEDGDETARAAAESGELDQALIGSGFVAPNTDMLNRRLNLRQFYAKPDATPGRDAFVDLMFSETLAKPTRKEAGIHMRANYAGFGDEGYDADK